MQGYRADLQRAGHIVTSRWIDLAEEVEADAAMCAGIDIEDIELADTVITLGDEPRLSRSRGGHWVEFGCPRLLLHRGPLRELSLISS
jgi:hypothetical protein